MNETSQARCEKCGTEDVSRIWNATIRTGGMTPDVGQGSSSAPRSSGGVVADVAPAVRTRAEPATKRFQLCLTVRITSGDSTGRPINVG